MSQMKFIKNMDTEDDTKKYVSCKYEIVQKNEALVYEKRQYVNTCIDALKGTTTTIPRCYQMAIPRQNERAM